MKIEMNYTCVECENEFNLLLFFNPSSSYHVRNEYADPQDASCEPSCCPFCDKDVDAFKLAFES